MFPAAIWKWKRLEQSCWCLLVPFIVLAVSTGLDVVGDIFFHPTPPIEFFEGMEGFGNAFVASSGGIMELMEEDRSRCASWDTNFATTPQNAIGDGEVFSMFCFALLDQVI